jgi:hypothetical protein
LTETHSPQDGATELTTGYAGLLLARKEALEALSRTSEEVREALLKDGPVDIGDILDRREEDCKRLAAIWAGIDVPEPAALTPDAIALQSLSEELAQRIIACQSECEAMLKQRIDTTAQAIRESSHRRKLNAAYGPSGGPVAMRPQRALRSGCIGPDTPTFLDKQQ